MAPSKGKALRAEQVVTGTELATLTGYTAQRVTDYMREPGAPAPWKNSPSGRLWEKDPAVAWVMRVRTRGPAKGTVTVKKETAGV